MEIETLRRSLNKKIAARKHAYEKMVEEEKELRRLEDLIAKIIEAQEHLQALAQAVQQKAHEQIGQIVSKCLTAVFDDMYELHIDFVQLRGKTEARLLYRKQGNEVDPLLTSGGVLDVSALAMRLANLVLSDPPRRRLLVLDEPFVGVDSDHMPRLCEVIRALAEELEVQFLIVTHNEQLQIGKVIRL